MRFTHGILPFVRGLLARDNQLPLLTPAQSSDDNPLCATAVRANDGVFSEPVTEEQAREAHRIVAALPGNAREMHLEALGKVAIRRPERQGRIQGKVAVVTGAAQGFGLEIATGMIEAGAVAVLADINAAGVKAAAERLNQKHGSEVALGVAVDVTQPESLQAAVALILAHWGGVDVLVSNAGIVRAGSVLTQPIKDFDLVTRVNYTGYFAAVQAFAPVMSHQHQAAPQCLFDIIQINSKSGLVGSNKNGAYSGSKFGGIGLTQSFALELVTHGIKVNAICPGNFLDGPLWSDPERGLFVQYLKSGKVPGARTVADVRRFYEAKVPLRRGCTTADVMHALLYLIDQPYETGQAIPVTGGQVMLS